MCPQICWDSALFACAIVSTIMTTGITLALIMQFRQKRFAKSGEQWKISTAVPEVTNPEIQVRGAQTVKRGCHLPSAIFAFLLAGFTCVCTSDTSVNRSAARKLADNDGGKRLDDSKQILHNLFA
jgi:hypothetical protein